MCGESARESARGDSSGLFFFSPSSSSPPPPPNPCACVRAFWARLRPPPNCTATFPLPDQPALYPSLPGIDAASFQEGRKRERESKREPPPLLCTVPSVLDPGRLEKRSESLPPAAAALSSSATSPPKLYLSPDWLEHLEQKRQARWLPPVCFRAGVTASILVEKPVAEKHHGMGQWGRG